MEYMLRNWRNFCWLSGDDILEVFVHELDLMTWFVGKLPVKAIGWGGRQQRITGDLYDFFSIEYVYDNGMHANCASRQVNGCSNLMQHHLTGAKGFADCMGSISDLEGNTIWEYPHPKEGDPDQSWKMNDPFVQEHVILVSAIRSGKPHNNAEALANSTLIGIMGRISAYTGKIVTWEEVMNSDLYLGPKNYFFGPVSGISETPPVIGSSQTRSKNLYRDH
jgi:predicted dehydrogenase